jgi:hypothetical protein
MRFGEGSSVRIVNDFHQVRDYARNNSTSFEELKEVSIPRYPGHAALNQEAAVSVLAPQPKHLLGPKLPQRS